MPKIAVNHAIQTIFIPKTPFKHYHPHVNKKHTTLKLLITLAAIALASCGKKSSSSSTPAENAPEHTPSTKEVTTDPESFPEIPDPLDVDNLPRDTVENLGMKMDFSDPETIVKQLAKILSDTTEPADIDKLHKALGDGAFTKEQLSELKKRITEQRLTLDPSQPFEQIGQLAPGKHNRYAINFIDKSSIFLDLKRQRDGNWKVENVQIPGSKNTSPALTADALNYTHTFLKHLINQRFLQARTMVDKAKINDAKLAGLCIIFEEAKYTLDKSKPLRAIILKDTTAAFYANVSSDESNAKFSVIAQRKNPESPWLIHEINLDQLLGDYASKVAGGDIHYTPLLKNPGGGETLAIYFDFDSNGLTPRTTKQLDIVVALLKIDPNKKITISGHTDSKGTNAYNQNLSAERADAVKTYLAENGVPKAQILTKAFGPDQPRLPNQAQDGTDDPSARRANRRTEIYLDF